MQQAVDLTMAQIVIVNHLAVDLPLLFEDRSGRVAYLVELIPDHRKALPEPAGTSFIPKGI